MSISEERARKKRGRAKFMHLKINPSPATIAREKEIVLASATHQPVGYSCTTAHARK